MKDLPKVLESGKMEHLTGPCDFREGIIPSIFTYIFFFILV
jgi:hypothetical protein